MKIGLYYFTGTGNSLAVTRDLAEQVTGDVEIVSIAAAVQEKDIVAAHDVVGIIYPVWLHHIPPIVEEFINKLIVNDAYIFAVCTYAVNAYNSLFDINDLLEQKGYGLASGFGIAMGGKYVLAKDITFAEEENQKRFSQEKHKVKEIAALIKDKKQVGIEGNFDEQDQAQLIDFHRNIYKVPEKFWVDEKCNLCGQCTQICPRANIDIVDNKVIWQDKCEYCLACLHWCPKAAIQNGEISADCKRYHHPDIAVTDIIMS